MAKLASFRRIIKTDFKEDVQPLVEQLGISINNGFDTVYDALNGKLSFEENILATITTFNVTVNSDGTPQQKTQFKLKDSQNTLQGIIILNVQPLNNVNALALGGVGITYNRSQNFVNIVNVKGLEPNIQYGIKVIALG